MDKIKTTEGDLIVRDARFGIVASRFNDFIVDSLLKASVRCLQKHGAADADIEIVRVPGAFEMPLMVDKLASSRRFDGIVALGCVIRGRTSHYDVVVEQSANGLMLLGLQGLCIGNGIITVENMEQAEERADADRLDSAGGAAAAALHLIALARRFGGKRKAVGFTPGEYQIAGDGDGPSTA